MTNTWSQGGVRSVSADNWTATVYMGGDYDDAVRELRHWCEMVPDCWAIERCDYVYTGCMESGFRMTRINYPRFPFATEAELQNRAIMVAKRFMRKLRQRSCTVVGPLRSVYMTRTSMV